MQKIVPSIWFDHTAAEAVAFYTEHFPDSRVLHEQRYPSTGLPDFQREFAGEVLAIDFELRGFRFSAINAGPEFEVNQSISFTLPFDEAADPDARTPGAMTNPLYAPTYGAARDTAYDAHIRALKRGSDRVLHELRNRTADPEGSHAGYLAATQALATHRPTDPEDAA